MHTFNYRFDTKHGPIFGDFAEAGLRRLFLFDVERKHEYPDLAESIPEGAQAHALNETLARYFAGAPEDFAALTLSLVGTEFQRRVWDGALRLPWGKTETYGALTAALGLSRESARAVGAALGANPVCLLVPCHRFLGADGALTGYAGGLAWKRRLLEIEGSLLPMGH